MARAQFSRYRALANWCQSRRQDQYTSEPERLGKRPHDAPGFLLGAATLPEQQTESKSGTVGWFGLYGNQEYGGSWLIEPMGYAFGNLFGSIYESFNPAGTPGAEVRFAPNRNFYVQSAVMAGNRDPYNQDPTGFHFQIRDTPNFLFETGYLVHPLDGHAIRSRGSAGGKSYPGAYKFGGVYNGGKFSDPAGHMSNSNYLIYGMASQAVFRSDAGSNRGLDATFGFDWTPGDVSRENVQITTGARFNAPFASRKMDRVACGFVYSKIQRSVPRFW